MTLVDELNDLRKKVLEPLNIKCSKVLPELESAEYDAFSLQLNKKVVQYRRAKITPTKIGQFVTLWKRDSLQGEIRPYTPDDNLDLAIIATRQENRLGYFIFPMSVLCEQGIAQQKKPGKRGFRLYPVWDKPISKQAIKSQMWQLKYFFELTLETKPTDEGILNLLSCIE